MCDSGTCETNDVIESMKMKSNRPCEVSRWSSILLNAVIADSGDIAAGTG